MRTIPLALLLVCCVGAVSAGPDLTGLVPVLDETFADGLNRYDGRSGLWSTLPRRGLLMTNAAEAVFLDGGVLDGVTVPAVHVATDQGLALRSVALPDAVLPALRDYMKATGQGKAAPDILYATGMISTAQTWAQTYGYFEIEARIPRGQGRWPAFWLSFAGLGWPPEIDVMEAYGEGFLLPTKKDDRFITGVLFDALDADLAPTHAVNIENPYSPTDEGRQASVKMRGKLEVHTFAQQNDAAALGADIYGDFNTYAALWTPETITFYFGTDRASLREIFRTPTPADANDPMYLIANDQFTARGGGWPARGIEAGQVLDPDNAFLIRRITIMAAPPLTRVQVAAGANADDPQGSLILDTPGDDDISPGAGFDIITLTGGADRLRLTRGHDNKIIAGFGPDDVLLLDGYPFADAADALARLTQVGPDVWLPSGADPGWPQTLIFRQTEVAAFSAAQFQVRWSVGRDVWAADAARQTKADLDLDGDGLMTSPLAGAWLNDRDDPVTMTGTTGPDRFLVANARTKIIEAAAGDVDTLIAFVSMALPANVERGIARGDGITLQGGAGDDRLEAEGSRITLQGGQGDDLFVIAPDAVAATVHLGIEDGHDQLRGMGAGHQLRLSDDLTATRTDWTLTDGPDGAVISFGPSQSLLIEGYDRVSAAQAVGMAAR